MTVSFDTLSFAKRLTEAGEKPAVAEAHAMALKEFVMETIATKADVRELRTEIEDVRDEIQDLRGELRSEMQSARGELRSEMQSVRGEIQDFRKEVEERFATKHELRHEIGLLRKDIDAMGLKLTVRMGGMLAVAVGAVAALGKVL
jgi:uncharacterized coiled-coil DUF342 family protein